MRNTRDISGMDLWLITRSLDGETCLQYGYVIRAGGPVCKYQSHRDDTVLEAARALARSFLVPGFYVYDSPSGGVLMARRRGLVKYTNEAFSYVGRITGNELPSAIYPYAAF